MFLQLNHLKKLYDANNGLKRLDLSVEKGEFVTLLGPSGCGKTTTLNLLGGFLKADEGQILLDGQDITALPPEERPISTVFQSYALFPHMNVLENVCYGLRYLRRMSKRDAIPVAREFLAIVGLADYEKARVGNLSGGQQQRVALARAMATSPKILLLDEPISNLDAGLRIKMRQELKELQRSLGITMIFVTHDQEEALCLSDKIVVMEQGVAAQVGTPQEIYFQPQNRYVASFVGKSNYFERGGETVVVRPEDVELIPNPQGRFAIVGRTFMGSHTSYLLDDGTYRLEADLFGRANSDFPVGERVEINAAHSFTLGGTDRPAQS